MKNILVTGGAGFVGAHLAIGLATQRTGMRVTALDNLKRRGSEFNLPRLREAGVSFVHGDVRNPEDFEAVGPNDLIIECSAEASVLAGYGASPEYVVNTNLMGAVNCFEFARLYKAGVILLSTSRVYPIALMNALKLREAETRFELTSEQTIPGVSDAGISEAFPLDGPRSFYGASKLCAELMLDEYGEAHGVRGVVNRCGVVTGPWQMGKPDQGVVALWAARHILGGSLSYIGYGGRGKQVRDMLHVKDLLALVLYQVEHLDDLAGRTFNVGGGYESSISLLELTELCCEITGNSIDVSREEDARNADVPLFITDHRKVSDATGWRPTRDKRAILVDVCRWVTDHADALRQVLGE